VNDDRPPSPPDRPAAPDLEPAPSPAARSPMAELALARLSRALGPTRGLAVMDAALAQMGARGIETPQDLLDFSEHLIRQDGMVRAVGRGLKIIAGFHGAAGSA